MAYQMTDADLQRLKKIEIELLDELERVCQKYHLTYFLFGGTLLGAVRHGGFIPWDDDVDVVMPRADLQRLIQIAETAFDSKFFLQTAETEAAYPLMVAKLRRNGTVFEELAMENTGSHKGVFIDIFPMDQIDASNASKVEKRRSAIAFLTTVICYLCGYDYGISGKMKVIAKFLGLFGVKQLKKKRLALMTRDNANPNIDTVTVFASNYGWKKQLFSKSVYFPPGTTVFEGRNFPAPHNTDAFLTQIYGDYMQLPPLEKRVTRHPIAKIDLGRELYGEEV